MRAKFVRRKKTVHIEKIQFKTDSTATLGWIKSTKRQKLFLANSIAKIVAKSHSEQLIFATGKIDPAEYDTTVDRFDRKMAVTNKISHRKFCCKFRKRSAI